MSRLATVLRCTLRIIGDGLRRGAARLLIAERGKFTTLLAKASDEANELRFVGGLRFACSLSGHGGLAGENELRDVGESDGVTAGDALASELPDEIAEEEIDLIGGGETVDVGCCSLWCWLVLGCGSGRQLWSGTKTTRSCIRRSSRCR
jgi:hypothetical protein